MWTTYLVITCGKSKIKTRKKTYLGFILSTTNAELKAEKNIIVATTCSGVKKRLNIKFNPNQTGSLKKLEIIPLDQYLTNIISGLLAYSM
ncbi:hypothetical protein PCA01_04820 [Pseudoalteromonas carrageenovora]|nr:hypothetical protein PCA01_04820 [Pseudoalteromonas carrageenovora]